MWSWVGELGDRRGAVAGDGDPRIFGSTETLPTLGHTFLGSWESSDLARSGSSERADVEPLGFD